MTLAGSSCVRGAQSTLSGGRWGPLPPASTRPTHTWPSRASSPCLGVPLGHHIPGTCCVGAGAPLLMQPRVLLPGGDRGQVRVDRRQLHWRGHLLGARGAAHQNKGIPVAAVGRSGSAQGPQALRKLAPMGPGAACGRAVTELDPSQASSQLFPGPLQVRGPVSQSPARLPAPSVSPEPRPRPRPLSVPRAPPISPPPSVSPEPRPSP